MVMRLVMVFVLLLVGCGAPTPAPGTGGGALPAGRCGRGLMVVQSDYQSTNVSLVDGADAVVSSSFISSASADAGLSAALSGDVVAPTSRVSGEEAVLIDRYPASLVTWTRIATAEVRAQLDVRTGFASNPQDYLALSPTKAYLSRFESNTMPGSEAFDAGGDVLVLDPSEPAILGRIDLHDAVADAPGVLPRANRMVQVGRYVVVLLSAYSADFTTSAASRLAVIDPESDTVVDVTAIDGFEGCAGLTVESAYERSGNLRTSPRLAVACSGSFGGEGNANLTTSGLAWFEVVEGQANELGRVTAEAIAGRPLGFSVAFADADRLLVVGVGRFVDGGQDQPDALFSVSMSGADASELLQTPSRPFELGEIRCAHPVQADGDETRCGRCWVADAERGAVHPLRVGDAISADEPWVADEAIGLAPRTLGGL
jgi:hypothetical protein